MEQKNEETWTGAISGASASESEPLAVTNVTAIGHKKSAACRGSFMESAGDFLHSAGPSQHTDGGMVPR